MNYYFRAFKLVFLLLFPFFSIAQIQVSFPTSRAVFQRDKSNQATLRIVGYYTVALTRVEARLQARDGQGMSTDWRTIQDNASGGVYAGDLTGSGGWYNLEVRGINNGQQVGSTTIIERVGIGEVFIVAGQSNAQGIHQNAPNPANDRVNCVNYQYPASAYPNDPPMPVFTQLDNSPGFTIAPRGVGSWCWGQLGDLLVKRLNVPVMFFNTAFTGTAVQNWRQSAPEGGTAYSIYNGQPYSSRQPYINLKIALQFYTNMLGLRAVLWQQGEADNLINTPTSQYISDLQFVINQTRHDYNKNMAWVISRTSYGDFIGGSDPAITVAQDMVIGSAGNTFTGPNTDVIQIPRKRAPLFDTEGLHFDYDGLVEVANAWSTSLNDSFFQNSTPISPSPAPTISITCAGNNNLKISINENYPNVQWTSGESGNTITKGAGTYQAKIKDNLGNTLFSAQVNVPNVIAAIVDNGQPYVCAGNSLNLTTNYNNVTWVNQQNNTDVANTQTFSTNTEGAFYVRYRDVSGCDFTSNVINISIKPLPATPTITNDKSTTFCQGDNTVLRTNTDNIRYNWSNGQQSKNITVGASGSYFLTVTDQFNCTSNRSNTIDVTANPVPSKPVITASGPTTFCADRNIILTASQDATYQWDSGQITQSITLNASGNFTVRTKNQFGCISEQSDIVTITVNPLPASPTVSTGGSTTFCDGNSVTLTAASPIDVVWSSGQTNKVIVVTSSGNYAAQARDQIGCLSPYSTIIPVKVNPLPDTPTILATPDRIICEEDQATLRVDGEYTVFWSTGDSTQRITTNTAGTYSAKVRDTNGCVSLQAGNIAVELRPLPDPPTINVIGTYTLEAITSANGNLFHWYRDTDSLSSQSPVIKANQSGLYTARSSVIYSPTLTCFSHPSAPISFIIDSNNQGLSIYPNPSPDKVVILETQENLINATVSLFTLSGQQVFITSVPLLDERKRFSLLSLPAGSYVLRVQAAGFDVSKRILLGL